MSTPKKPASKKCCICGVRKRKPGILVCSGCEADVRNLPPILSMVMCWGGPINPRRKKP